MQVNGIELAVAEHGSPGRPAVVLLHRFPELGFSCRRQVGPLVDAGYRVLVPDLRGFGGSEAPPDPRRRRSTPLFVTCSGWSTMLASRRRS